MHIDSLSIFISPLAVPYFCAASCATFLKMSSFLSSVSLDNAIRVEALASQK